MPPNSFHIYSFAAFIGKRQTLFLITSENIYAQNKTHKYSYRISKDNAIRIPKYW